MIALKSAREIEVMAEGGRILGATVAHLRAQAKAGVTTLQLDEMAEAFIRSHEGATPAFKGLYGFPGSVCADRKRDV